MLPDYHLHTTLSKHSQGTPGEFKAQAAATGMPEMCFTDHAPNPHGLAQNVCIDTDKFGLYLPLIEELRDGEGPEVLYGIEADFYPGCEEHLGSWLPQQNFDLVLGSVHFLGDWYFDDPAYADTWKDADVEDAWRRYFSMIGRLAESRLFDAVAHLDIVKKFGYRPSATMIAEIGAVALDGIAAADMAIEINTAGLRKVAEEIYPSEILLQLACERSIPIFFSSDAHRPEDVGWCFDEALQLARSAGYKEYCRFRGRVRTLEPLPQMDS